MREKAISIRTAGAWIDIGVRRPGSEQLDAVRGGDETTMTVDARDGAQVASGVTRLMLDGTAADQHGARAVRR